MLNKLKSYKVLMLLLFILLLTLFIFIKRTRHHFFRGEEVSTMGKIINLKTNPRGDVDRITILAKNQEITLGFPPHLASEVLDVGTIKDKVIVLYELDPNHFDSRLITISNPEKHKSFDLREHHPPMLEKGQNISLEINSFKFNVDNRGNPNGIIYDNYLIEIRPDLLEQLMPLIEKAKIISIKGVLRNHDNGFVNHFRYKIVKAISIELENKTYLLD